MSSAFGETLQYITSVKLQELGKQRSACRAYVESALRDAQAAPSAMERLKVLQRRIEEWKGLGSLVSDDVSLPNYKLWALQAEHDPSIPESLVKTWADKLEHQLRQTVTRYDYAQLFGDLLEEWIGSGDSLALPAAAPVGADFGDDVVLVPTGGRHERVEQQERIQELIFTSKHIDTDAYSAYLQRLFAGEDGAAVLWSLREKVKDAGEEIRCYKLGTSQLRNLMHSLLARDLLNAEKTATLRSFIDNDVILEEIASVLSMQMAGLNDWDWPEDGVRVEMRRHLSGKYRAYMDSEIIQALLFQHIGMQWSIHLKSIFAGVVNSRAWKRDVKSLSQKQLQRREQFIHEHHGFGAGNNNDWNVARPAYDARHPVRDSIEARRRAMQSDKFFLTQLPSNIEAENAYDDDEQEAGSKKANHGAHAQQVLLRLVSTEISLRQKLYGQCTVVRADLEWFGPSLSHDAILTALRFYGMDVSWMNFFGKWLQAKLRFEGSAAAQTRKRGVPIAQALSVLCGEVLLFGMDFAVNQAASGLYVYRIYDDFWFFHHNPELCAAAWKEMNTYADLCGITFNKKKTGAVCVGSDLEPSLPRGPVGWGFITLDAAQGRFVVDQSAVDVHIAELKRQLVNAKSVFGFVNALNKYLEFMRRNFAKPAHCFGVAHADEVVATFGRIYREVFADANGSVAHHLQAMMAQRFGTTDIPSGWVFLPSAQGGLGVVNPIIDILALYRALDLAPSQTFAGRVLADEADYKAKLDAWYARALGDDDVMSWDEYVLGRETVSSSWSSVWQKMQETPSPREPISRKGTSAAISTIEWRSASTFEQWVISLYGDELVEKFGSLQAVEPTLIPVGLLSTFRSSKVAWDQ